MTWTRLGDTFADQPRVAELSDAAFRLHVEGLVYCNRLTTDGRLARSQLRKVTSVAEPDFAVAELERQELWTPIEGDDAWQLDWTDQEAAVDVRERARYNAEKSKRARQRRDHHRRGDHRLCDPRYCKERQASEAARDGAAGADTGNDTGNDTGIATGVVTDSRPDPSRPGPKEAGTGTVRRCEHGLPISADGAGCHACVEAGIRHLVRDREAS